MTQGVALGCYVPAFQAGPTRSRRPRGTVGGSFRPRPPPCPPSISLYWSSFSPMGFAFRAFLCHTTPLAEGKYNCHAVTLRG